MLFYTCDSIPATLFTVATIPGTAIGGVIADKWGKKLTMCTSNLLTYKFWVIAAFTNNKYLLFLSYSFQGFFGIIGFNLVGKHKLMKRGGSIFLQLMFIGIYIVETAAASLNRKMGPFHSIFQCIGFLIGYVITAFFSWRQSYLILGSLVTLPSALFLFFFHETPHWLIRKGNLDKARYYQPWIFINFTIS